MHKKSDWPKIWLLMKNLQFWRKFHETFAKGPAHELVKWGKFQRFYSKIEDFSLIAKFLASPIFYA